MERGFMIKSRKKSYKNKRHKNYEKEKIFYVFNYYALI